MRILIVQENIELGGVWARHLERMGIDVCQVSKGDAAFDAILDQQFDAIVLDLVLRECSALAISDFAQFNQPTANIVFVTDTSFFSDGSIFSHASNARAMLETATPPEDLAAIVHHYACDASRARAAQENPEQGSSE